MAQNSSSTITLSSQPRSALFGSVPSGYEVCSSSLSGSGSIILGQYALLGTALFTVQKMQTKIPTTAILVPQSADHDFQVQSLSGSTAGITTILPQTDMITENSQTVRLISFSPYPNPLWINAVDFLFRLLPASDLTSLFS